MVKVRDCIRLVADKIVEAVRRIGVDEAVADPLARTNGLVDVSHDFKGGLNAVFFNLASIEGCNVVFTRVAENIKGFVTGKSDQLAIFGPVDLIQISKEVIPK